MRVGGIAQPHDLRSVEVKVARDFVGAATDEGFVEHDAERVNVDASVHLVGRQFELLRGHVRGRADDRAHEGLAVIGCIETGQSSDAEVDDAGMTIGADQQIRGLEVAVDDAAVVAMLQTVADLGELARDVLRLIG